MRAQISQVITFNAVNQDPVFFNPNPTKFICGYVGRPFDLNLWDFYSDPDGHDLIISAAPNTLQGLSYVAPSYYVGSGTS